MFSRITCLIKGHKKYNPDILKGSSLIDLKDATGSHLVSINVCERCGKVYSSYLALEVI